MNIIKTFLAMTLLVAIVTASNAQSVQPASPRLQLEQQIKLTKEKLQTLTDQQSKNFKALVEATREKEIAIKRQDEVGSIASVAIPEILTMLQQEQITLTIDLAGLEARKEMLSELNARRKIDSDAEVLKPLENIVDIERQVLARKETLHEKGMISENELLNLRRKVLAAEVQLAQARSQQSDSATAGRLNANLLEISLDYADRKARLEVTNSLLDKFGEARELVNKATRASEKVDRLEQSKRITEEKLRRDEAMLRALNQRLESLKEFDD